VECGDASWTLHGSWRRETIGGLSIVQKPNPCQVVEAAQAGGEAFRSRFAVVAPSEVAAEAGDPRTSGKMLSE
jgi:hypothetical protein